MNKHIQSIKRFLLGTPPELHFNQVGLEHDEQTALQPTAKQILSKQYASAGLMRSSEAAIAAQIQADAHFQALRVQAEANGKLPKLTNGR